MTWRGIADNAGRLRVVVAADSGFEGRTRLFFTRVHLLLERVGPA